MASVTPVILAGGLGTRLWPLSRKSYPKQFSSIIGEHSLFQQSALRLSSSSKIKFEPHLILTNVDFRFIVGDQLQEVGIDPGPILIEPEAKNTAPSILAASLYAFKNDNNAVLLVAPSDHVITDTSAFHDAINIGLSEVTAGKIVTFGIAPTSAETGYGYLELEKPSSHNVANLIRFIEKPTREKAEEMLEQGNYLWNAGIFLFRAQDMIEAFNLYDAQMCTAVTQALEKAKPDLHFLRLNVESWKECSDISIDFAIMEKARNLVVVPFSAGWSDLGNWDAVWTEMGPDGAGLAISPHAHAIECKNTLLRSESDTQELVGLGLDGIIAIAMPDAILVAHKDRAQEVKGIVAELKLKKVKQAEAFSKDHRPWGWFETLAITDRFQVKRICVHPGAALSLQSHHHRSEHWVIVEGTAKVTVQGEEKLVTEGESVYIPMGSVHRMKNPGELLLIVIEVQTGSYLGEDDIIRYEDIYSRL